MTGTIIYNNANGLQEKFPKAFAAFKNFILSFSLISDVDGKPLDIDATFIVQYSPRLLYDFFDSKGIFIGILYRDSSWKHTNNYTNEFVGATDRHSAEISAFELAFETLENQLK